MDSFKNSKAVIYAKWCVKDDNKRVPKYVKKQAVDWLLIVSNKDKEAYVCQKAYNKICKLLRLFIHPDLNKPLFDCMDDYAWFLITAIFCTKTREGNFRFYQTALLEICRKNFKTFYSGVIFILGMLINPPMCRYFSVAPDKALSSELQIAIKKIIKSSPALNDKIFKNMRSEIRCLINDSTFTPLAYSEDKLDGKYAHIFLADEAGAMDDYPLEAMRSSQITLRNKLGVVISTQYPNDNNALITEIDFAKIILDKLVDERRYFSLLYEPDDEYKQGDLWKTEDTIIYQSNPVAVTYPYIFEDLIKKRKMAILYENKRENYLCKHNNIMYKGLGVECFVEITKVRECKIAEDLNFWRGKRVWLGLDLSQTDDNTALAMVTFQDDEIYCKVWGFIPADRMDFKTDKEKVNYERFCNDGVCFACGDDIIDYGFVEDFILSLSQKYEFEIIQCGFDRYNAMSTVQKLEAAADPIECVEIKQHSSVLHPATKLLYESILSKKFHYDENKLLEINFQTGTVAIDGTITVTGRLVENSVASDKSFPLLTNGSNPYLSIAGVYLNQSISPTPLYVAVKKDNVIKLNGYNNATSSAGPTLIKYVTCTYDSAVSTQTAYRVSRNLEE